MLIMKCSLILHLVNWFCNKLQAVLLQHPAPLQVAHCSLSLDDTTLQSHYRWVSVLFAQDTTSSFKISEAPDNNICKQELKVQHWAVNVVFSLKGLQIHIK